MSRLLTTAAFAAMSLVLPAVGCVGSHQCTDCGKAVDGGKVYDVVYVPKVVIKFDGSLDEPAWQKAVCLTDFSLPWEKTPAPRLEFRAICDDENLYFAFRVCGSYAPAGKEGGEDKVVEEDRVELYLSCDDSMKEYYGLEIDSLGRVLDYKASHYRNLDGSWRCPGLKAAGKAGADGYVVEGSIPLATLVALRMPLRKDGDKVLAALFRGIAPHDGDRQWHWESWVDPKIEKPDFHVPGVLGYLRLKR
ncbi:MAG: carbohydrate-binding family 9-like protein [Phycisphaerae bacterium]